MEKKIKLVFKVRKINDVLKVKVWKIVLRKCLNKQSDILNETLSHVINWFWLFLSV